MAAQKKFKVGDMVIGTSDNYFYTCKGWVGKVTKVGKDGWIDAYGSNGAGKQVFTGLDPKCFEHYNVEKIVITHEGKKTTATLYKNGEVVEKATSKCHPEDEFDFNVGAKVALDRLIEKTTKPKYYNGKIVCVAYGYENRDYLISFDSFTIGKVYQVVDGVITNDIGIKYDELLDLHSICCSFGNTFIPIVE